MQPRLCVIGIASRNSDAGPSSDLGRAAAEFVPGECAPVVVCFSRLQWRELRVSEPEGPQTDRQERAGGGLLRCVE